MAKKAKRAPAKAAKKTAKKAAKQTSLHKKIAENKALTKFKVNKASVFVIPHPNKKGRWALKYYGAKMTFASYDDREAAADAAMAMPNVVEVVKYDAKGEVTSILSRVWRKNRLPKS